MRFAHRRRMDEGEFGSAKGGFFGTPPSTPPAINRSANNGLCTPEGELGDFSLPLHVGGDTPTRRSAYIHHSSRALATCTPTPPAHPISATKSLQNNDKAEGGVLPKTPPDAPVDPISQIRDLPMEIISGLDCLRDRKPPTITRPTVWQEIVDDALTLAINGWARRALNAGWDVLDIFGVGIRSSCAFKGLAVWLAGREIGGISEWTAHSTCGATFYREAYGRPNSPRLPSVPLWRFGINERGAS